MDIERNGSQLSHGFSVTLMKMVAATFMTLSLLASASSQTGGQTNQAGAAARTGAATSASTQDAQPLSVMRSSSPPEMRPAENFTGSLSVEPLVPLKEPARLTGARVTFAPGARTNWHTHPLGQTLIVTAGVGWVQHWGGPTQEIRPGDIVRIQPNQKHWHGASANAAMTPSL